MANPFPVPGLGETFDPFDGHPYAVYARVLVTQAIDRLWNAAKDPHAEDRPRL